MIESTKDIFWLIASISLGLATIFFCWGVYYLIMILRNFHRLVHSIRAKIDLIDRILQLIRDKLEKTSSHLSLIADSLIKVVGFFIERQKEKREEREEQGEQASGKKKRARKSQR